MLLTTRVIVVASWALMLAILTRHHLQRRAPEASRARTSRLGILLQAIAYGAVFGIHSNAGAPLGRWGVDPRAAGGLAMLMAVTGGAIVVWCQWVLGLQWSLTARLIKGHRLVTSGPYAWVRHPIYAAMIPMLAATAIAFSTPLVLLVSLVLYVGGTRIRIASEERLMEAAFGEQWDSYRRRVPPLLPLVGSGVI